MLISQIEAWRLRHSDEKVQAFTCETVENGAYRAAEMHHSVSGVGPVMGYTGSVTENRVTIGIPPMVRQAYYDKAKLLGMRQTELMRHVLIESYFVWEQQTRRSEPNPITSLVTGASNREK